MTKTTIANASSENDNWINSFHDHFDRGFRPLFGEPQNFDKIEIFHSAMLNERSRLLNPIRNVSHHLHEVATTEKISPQRYHEKQTNKRKLLFLR